MGKCGWLLVVAACGLGLAWAGEERQPAPEPRGPVIGPPEDPRAGPARGQPGEEPGRRPDGGRPDAGRPDAGRAGRGGGPDMMRQFAEFAGLPMPLIQFWREIDPEGRHYRPPRQRTHRRARLPQVVNEEDNHGSLGAAFGRNRMPDAR